MNSVCFLMIRSRSVLFGIWSSRLVCLSVGVSIRYVHGTTYIEPVRHTSKVYSPARCGTVMRVYDALALHRILGP